MMSNSPYNDTVQLRIDGCKKESCSDPLNAREPHEISPNPWGSDHPQWNKIFLASCVIGVSIDPLFPYILTINNDKKCLDMDHRLKNIALVLRNITDLGYVLHIIFRLQSALRMSKELRQSIFRGLPWSYLLIDVLAILPLPQVIVLLFFSKTVSSKSMIAMKVLNLLLPFQYVPRILRVYLSAKELGSNLDSITRRVWVRGAFFFFLYIIFGHVFRALWYYYSIFRETKCWHLACEKHPEYAPCPLIYCVANTPMKNLTHLNKFCPVNPTNPKVFDFGIFADAIESRILGKTDFLIIFARSFWWGLKSLSSFGQNLDTSSNVEENLFAVLISILSLLLFLYLIGNLQTYIQLETTKSEEARRKLSIKQPEIKSYLSNRDHNIPKHKQKAIMRYLKQRIKEDKDFDVKDLLFLLEEHADPGQHNSSDQTLAAWVTKIMDVKKHDRNITGRHTDLWIFKNEIPQGIKKKISDYVKLRLLDCKDVDIVHLLLILPFSLGMSIKEHFCIPMLKKVPLFKKMDACLLRTICKFLKPVIYSEKSYIIKKGEPLDMMLFITQGDVWTFETDTSTDCLRKGNYYGDKLIEWRFGLKESPISYSEFPISTANLKSHTKVEAFALMANDLERLLSCCWFKFKKYLTIETMFEALKPFAAASVQREFRHHIAKKRRRDKPISSHDAINQMCCHFSVSCNCF